MSDSMASASVVNPAAIDALMAEATTAIAAGQFDRVLALYDQAGDQLNIWQQVAWGHQLRSVGAIEAAESLFRRITTRSPQDAEGWLALGNCLSQQGDRAGAQQCFWRAHGLRGWPESADRGYEFSQDWFSDQLPNWDRYLAPLKGQPVQGFEIGSFEGMSACWLLDRVLTHPNAQFTCVEPDPQATFLGNLAKTGQRDRVQVLQQLSWEALAQLPIDHYDFAYVDGCHAPWVAFRDTVQTWPTLKSGGIVIIDDYRYKGEPEECPQLGMDLFMALFAGCFELLNDDYQLFLRKTRDWDAAAISPERLLLLTDDPLLLDALGCFLLQNGQVELAKRVCGRAITLYPTMGHAYFTLGQVWAKQGLQSTLAEAHLNPALRQYSPLARYLISYVACSQPSEVDVAHPFAFDLIVAYWQSIAQQTYWHEPIQNLFGLLNSQIQEQTLTGAIAAWNQRASNRQPGQGLDLPNAPKIYQRMVGVAVAKDYPQIVPLIEAIASIALSTPTDQ